MLRSICSRYITSKMFKLEYFRTDLNSKNTSELPIGIPKITKIFKVLINNSYVLQFEPIRSNRTAKIFTFFQIFKASLLIIFIVYVHGWAGSSVGIATGYGLDGPGIESR